MAATKIHCTVVETSANQDNEPQDFRGPANDLLPWADPYIASLMETLEDVASKPNDHDEPFVVRCHANRRSNFSEARSHFSDHSARPRSVNRVDGRFSRQRYFEGR